MRARAQTALPAIGVAFVLLTIVVVLGVSGAGNALVAAERPALERQGAVGVSEQLTSEQAPLTSRENVLQEPAIAKLNGSVLRDRYGLAEDNAARVRLDGEEIAVAGDVRRGTTVERIVLVERQRERTITPSFEGSRSTTLPRRSANATLEIQPPANTTVRSVWIDDRIVLYNESGIEGTFDVELSPFETAQLRLDAAGRLDDGSVRIDYYPSETRKATLEVTVDA